jgi:hypothetical protein
MKDMNKKSADWPVLLSALHVFMTYAVCMQSVPQSQIRNSSSKSSTLLLHHRSTDDDTTTKDVFPFSVTPTSSHHEEFHPVDRPRE